MSVRLDYCFRQAVRTTVALVCVLGLSCRVLGADAPKTTVAQPPISRADASRLLETLNDPEKRARFAADLQAMVQAMPAETQTQSASPTRPTPPTPASNASPQAVVSQSLRLASERVEQASQQFAKDFRSMTDLPSLTRWLRAKLVDPAEQSALLDGSLRIVGILVAAIATHRLLQWLIHRRFPEASAEPTAHSVGAVRFRHALRRLLSTFGSLLIALLLGNGLIIVSLGQFPVARSVAFGLTNAYLGLQCLLAVIDEYLRANESVPGGSSQGSTLATLAKALLVALVVAVALEFVSGDVMEIWGASSEATESVQKLLALAAHGVLILMVLASRRRVALWIRRQAHPGTSLSALLDAFAAVWPTIAIITIAGSWLVWAMNIPDTYRLIVRFVLATITVLLVSRFIGSLLLRTFDRRLGELSAASKNSFAGRVAGYQGSARAILRAIILVLTFIALTEAWGVSSIAWFSEGHLGYRFAAFIVQLLVLAILGVLAWEAADFAFERRVTRLMDSASLARATRLRTLQPIVRLALIILIILIVVMTALSAVGINVGPLLAGAGILGVALGFGSQKLVQDFITGIFLLVEDAVDVGDWVTVAGLSGSVEHISIRTIRLRAGDGSVHLIPFSAVTSVTNTNRGIGNAAVSVNVDPSQDTDRVSSLLKEIALEMRSEPDFASAMQSDLQLWGVDKVDGAMITIVGQIVCTDGGRWAVQREFNRRMKKRFEQEGIALGVPQQGLRVALSSTS